MDSFEWNKIFGAVLGTVLVIAGLNIVVGNWMAPHNSGKPGMEVAVVETPTNGGPAVVEVKPDWGTVIPVADLAAGEKVHQKCLQCHDFAKGGPNKIGPNLYGIVGSKHAHQAAFAYSPAIKALADKTWGYDEMNEFVKNPKAAVPGTKMSFPGLSKVQDRVNMIAYLRTLSDSPLSLPAPNPAAATPPAAPAEGATEPPAGELQAPAPGPAPAAGAPATPGAPTTPPAAAPGTTPAPATPPAH